MKVKTNFLVMVLLLFVLIFTQVSCKSAESIDPNHTQGFRDHWSRETKVGVSQFMTGKWDIDWFDFQIIEKKLVWDEKRDNMKRSTQKLFDWIPLKNLKEQAIENNNQTIDKLFLKLSGNIPSANDMCKARNMGEDAKEGIKRFWEIVERCKWKQ